MIPGPHILSKVPLAFLLEAGDDADDSGDHGDEDHEEDKEDVDGWSRNTIIGQCIAMKLVMIPLTVSKLCHVRPCPFFCRYILNITCYWSQQTGGSS